MPARDAVPRIESVPLAALVEAAAAATATRSRLAKVEAIAPLLRRLAPEEVPAAIALLLGKPRHGRTGIGWRTITAVRPEPAQRGTLTVNAADEAFGELAGTVGTGTGSAGRRDAVLRSLLGRATETEQDFLVRALLGEVRTGALDGVITDAVAAAAAVPGPLVRRAAMLCGDLGRTAVTAITGGERALSAVGLTPGVPVQPMLAGTAATVGAAVAATGEASVEYKLDGARIQVHRTGGRITAYTRSLADISARVPEVVSLVAGFPGGDLILDGETLTMDESGRARPFAETMSRFGASAAGDAELAVWFFDLLHAGGTDLIDRPLVERRAALAAVVGDRLMPGRITADPRIADQVYADAVSAGHEGVLVKAADSPYQAGRRGSAWLKVKPVHTYDLVVLAAEWGYGRRTGWLSNLHLGARDPNGAFGEPGGFVMVGKTFKGLTDALLAWQTEYFPTIETRSTAGVVHVRPTVVVEIAIDGVQRSTRYPGGVALRFARVKRYRTGDDAKEPEDADTIDALRALLPGAS